MPLRKTLGEVDSPYIISLLRLFETQSKETLTNFAVGYVEKNILPIYEKEFPGDMRPQGALIAARDWLAGKIKLPEAKKYILAAHAAAREAEGHPAAQAAARAAGQAASAIHSARHSIGIAFYGAAAIAYDRIGISAKPKEYEKIAEEECAKIGKALREVSVKNEKNPAKIKWRGESRG